MGVRLGVGASCRREVRLHEHIRGLAWHVRRMPNSSTPIANPTYHLLGRLEGLLCLEGAQVRVDESVVGVMGG